MTIPAVLYQHAEETSFLWLLRERAVRRSDFTRRNLAELDGRIEAHLDGLRIAGEAAWTIGKEVLTLEDAGDVFALASLAFESGRDDRIAEALAAAAKAPGLSRGSASALAWLDPAKSEKEARRLIASASPLHRRIGLSAFAVRRVDPGKPLLDAAADPEPFLRSRALRALGELGKSEHLGLCQKHLAAAEPEVRFAAAWSAGLMARDPQALAALKAMALENGEAFDLALRLHEPAAAAAWREKLPRWTAVLAAGVVGDPAGVPFLLEAMKEPPLARRAGEAYTFITGDDLDELKLSGPPPEGFEAGPTENPEDENVEMDPDDDLPWPVLSAVRARWESRKGAFTAGKRYLVGKEITPAACEEVLKTGKQRQRAAAAIELSLRVPKRPLFEVRAPGFRQ